MNPEDQLQERLDRLEAGESLEACLLGLPEEEAGLLKTAATFRALAYLGRPAGQVAAQRASLLRAATKRPAAFKSRVLSAVPRPRLNWPAAVPKPLVFALAGVLILVLIAGLAQTPKPAAPQFVQYLPVLNGSATTPNPQTGVVQAARGVVEIQTGAGVWNTAKVGQTLTAGQRIRTGDLSGASLLFYDGSQTRLGPATEVSIEALDARRNGVRVVQLSQVSGETDHDVIPSGDPASVYEVSTPSGSGTAKGTSFQVLVSATQLARFNVDKGAVAVTNLDVTVVVAAGQSTTIYIGEPPAPPVFRISGEGVVTQLGDVWRIGGRDFLVNTTPGAGRSITQIVGNPQLGDWVAVEGRNLPDGTNFADRIVLLHRAVENRFTFSGTVDTLGDTEWTVAGRTVGVTSETEIDAGIANGDRVEVSGVILDGGTLRAERIRLLADTGLPFEFTGVVESIAAGAWTISGIEVTVDGHTAIPDDPAVSDTVKVEGRILEGNTWLADEIKRLAADERRFEFNGTVEGIDPWLVSGIHFDTSPRTEIDPGIQTGDRVKVEGRVLDDGTWLAEEITLLDDEPRRFAFVGKVSGIDPWVIGGLDIIVNADTDIDDDIQIGDTVRVTGVILPDGTLLAGRIRRLGDDLGCTDVRTTIVSLDGHRVRLGNGETIEVTDGVQVSGDLVTNAVVIVHVCVSRDGTLVVVSIIVIVVPPPPPPSCLNVVVVIDGQISLPNGPLVRLADGTWLDLRLKGKGDKLEIRVNGRDLRIDVDVKGKGKRPEIDVKVHGKGLDRIVVVGAGKHALTGTLVVQACLTANGLVITVSGSPVPPPPPPGAGKVTICHIPPGNPANARTQQVDAPAVAGHLGHGDTLGPCPDRPGGDRRDKKKDDD